MGTTTLGWSFIFCTMDIHMKATLEIKPEVWKQREGPVIASSSCLCEYVRRWSGNNKGSIGLLWPAASGSNTLLLFPSILPFCRLKASGPPTVTSFIFRASLQCLDHCLHSEPNCWTGSHNRYQLFSVWENRIYSERSDRLIRSSSRDQKPSVVCC